MGVLIGNSNREISLHFINSQEVSLLLPEYELATGECLTLNET